MNSTQYSQTEKWQRFFTDFKRYALETESAHIPTVDAEAAERFFHQFRQHYAPFVKSGGAVNVWDVAGVGTDEVRNCAVLGWLLDCHGSHGQGDAFLRCFLDAVSMEELNTACRKHFPQAVHAHAPYHAMVENTYQQEEPDGAGPNSRVDIVIENESFLLFIEAKVRAGETGNQLKRYASILHSRAKEKQRGIVFLTPEREEPTDKSLVGDIALLSWRQLADSFEAHIAAEKSLWVPPVQQFCHHIRTF